MPRDISSSSSEDEGDDVSVEALNKRPTPHAKTATRYQCPADFVSFCHKPCSSTLTETLKKKQNELWLIKAPASFNPECFSDIKIPLSGLQTVKVSTAAGRDMTGSGQQIYNILASSHGTADLHLVTSDKRSSNSVVLGPMFSGLLNVCESYGDGSANLTPQVIPATRAPAIPAGLRQRFQPFGSKTPALSGLAASEADGVALGPSSTTLPLAAVKRSIDETGHEEEEEEENERKKKKKRKKEKRVKTEPQDAEEVQVKVEPVEMTEVPSSEGDVSEERRKKKKKKKDREREEEVEEGPLPSVSVKAEEVTVKPEPTDTSYGDQGEEGSSKKKKKKKKSRTDDD